jgi:hypothetical protein
VQEDFKMLAVLLPLFAGGIAGLSGLTKLEIGGVSFTIGSASSGLSPAFWAFMALTTIAAVIAFRDYSRAVLVEHALYNAIRYERHFTRLVRPLVPVGACPPVRPAQYFIDKFVPKLRSVTTVERFVYSIPTTFAPPIVLWVTAKHREAFIMFAYASTLSVAYALVGQRILGRYTRLFKSLSEAELEKDDPEITTEA